MDFLSLTTYVSSAPGVYQLHGGVGSQPVATYCVDVKLKESFDMMRRNMIASSKTLECIASNAARIDQLYAHFVLILVYSYVETQKANAQGIVRLSPAPGR